MIPPGSLLPHAVCWASSPRLVWTMVVTNAVTFLSYLSICGALFYMVARTRRVIARDWAWFVVGFALFIVACGSTHLLEVITTWTPIFWTDAGTNILTAGLSAYVAVMLIRRATTIGFSINDYAGRLAETETENQQMQTSLLAAQKLEDWSRMSTVLAHEINNPLEAIQNLLYLIRTTDRVSPEVAELAKTASEEATRVSTISRSTLSFFRHASQPESVDLLAATESVEFLLRSLLQRNGITMEIRTAGDIVVEALPGEPRQVLLNLIRNACEVSSKPGAKITVDLAETSSGVEIAVADQGAGIPPGVLPRLFEFGMSTKGEQGNGLGLWTVKHILAKHGGDVRVESKPGEGTRFILHWPRQCPAELFSNASASSELSLHPA